MLLGFRGAKDIGILWCCLLSKKNGKTPPIWRFLANTRLRKSCRGYQQQQQQQQRKRAIFWATTATLGASPVREALQYIAERSSSRTNVNKTPLVDPLRSVLTRFTYSTPLLVCLQWPTVWVTKNVACHSLLPKHRHSIRIMPHHVGSLVNEWIKSTHVNATSMFVFGIANVCFRKENHTLVPGACGTRRMKGRSAAGNLKIKAYPGNEG